MGEEAAGGREGPGELGPQARARVPVELRQLQRRPPEGVAVWPEALPGARGGAGGESLSRLCAVVDGPEGTPFAGGAFRLSVAVPFRYPFEPPKVRFLTPVYHPNIDSEGRICLDTFNRAWKPSLSLSAVLLTVRLLLAEPNPDDGLMSDIADEYRADYPLFCSKARDLVRQHAMEHVQRRVGATPPPPVKTKADAPRRTASAEAEPAEGRCVPRGQGSGATPLGNEPAGRGAVEAARDSPGTVEAQPGCMHARTGSGGGRDCLQGSPTAKRAKVGPLHGDRAGRGGELPAVETAPVLNSSGGGSSPSKDAPKRTSRLSLRRQ